MAKTSKAAKPVKKANTKQSAAPKAAPARADIGGGGQE
jgi:hypothetical protein